MASWPPDFQLAGWQISPKLDRISKDGESVTIKHKSMAVLVMLAEADGELLTRHEIMDAVWPGMDVTDDVLTQSIVELRKVFGDDARKPRVIETIPRVGFRLIAALRPAGADAAQSRQRQYFGWRIQRLAQAALAIIIIGVIYLAVTNFEHIDRAPVITVHGSPSIAVLPFVNMSDNPDNEFFSEGMSEEIRNLLAQIPELKVIGRTSSHAFKGKNEDLRVIGRKLGVSTVLEGSLRISGDRVRINVQLTDAADGALLWSDSYERMMTDVFAVQDDVAVNVIDALQIYVAAHVSRKPPTTNIEAYTLFLEARAAFYAAEVIKAERLLFDSLALDPDFAEAYEFLAFLYYVVGGVSHDAITAQQLVHEFTAKAIAIDPTMLVADVFHQTSAVGFDYQIGMIELPERALIKQPFNPLLLDVLVWVLQEAGYVEESLPWAERYLQVEPLSPFANAYYVGALYATGRTEEALARLEFRAQSDMGIDVFQLTMVGIELAENTDDDAIQTLTAWLPEHDELGPDWFAEISDEVREPVTGAILLDRKIEHILTALPEEEAFAWRQTLPALYLFFGHLDRYYELILATNPTDRTWHHAANFVWQGIVFRRFGFTSHPDYLKVVHLLGINRVWEKRGPPEFCEKSEGQWRCT